MICPQTKAECACNEFGKDKTCKPKPTMAEIERLLDRYVVAGGGVEARAALLAAIRQLSNSTQDGE